MSVCLSRVFQEEMGLIDGRQRDGIFVGQRFIGYFQIESVLLDYPGIAEAGVVAECLDEQDPSGAQTVKVFLALNEDQNHDFAVEGVIDFIREQFAIVGPIRVAIRDKLPMTRSGKISRTVLREWN